jgi:hypothetical protein
MAGNLNQPFQVRARQRRSYQPRAGIDNQRNVDSAQLGLGFNFSSHSQVGNGSSALEENPREVMGAKNIRRGNIHQKAHWYIKDIIKTLKLFRNDEIPESFKILIVEWKKYLQDHTLLKSSLRI